MRPGMRPAFWMAGIFWALAVGVAAGAGLAGRALSPAAVRSMEGRFALLERRLHDSRAELARVRGELALYHQAVEGLLEPAVRAVVEPGTAVEVWATPGASGRARRLVGLLRQAGLAAELVRDGQPAGLPASADGVVVRSGEALVVGLVGPGGPLEPAVAGPAGPAAWEGPAPLRVARVDRIETPLGLLTLVEALAGCREGYLGMEEALAQLGRALAGERGGACLARGGPDRADGAGASERGGGL